MRPDKQTVLPAQRRTTLRFPDFGRLDTVRGEKSLTGKDAPEIVNFTVNRRALSDGWALESVASATGEFFSDLFVYRRYDAETGTRKDSLVARARSGKCYRFGLYDGGGFLQINGLTFSDSPVAVNYRLNGRDVLVLCSAAEGMKVLDGTTVTLVPDAPKITSACVHYERLFVTVAGERNAVWFSDDLDITNWKVSLEGAGFIEMADDGGALLKAVSFADRVYLFRRYSIARLTAYADQTEFSLSTLYVSSGRILEDTVCVCGDRILFVARNGIFVFDGVSTTRVLERLDGRFDYGASGSFACYWEGKYVLSAFDKAGYNLLLFYDVNTGEETLVDCGTVCALCSAGIESASALYAVTASGSSTLRRFVPEGGDKIGFDKRYRSKTVLPASGRRVRIARVRLDSAAPVQLSVRTEEGEEIFSHPGGGLCEMRCGLRGRELRFSLSASGNGHLVYAPVFEILNLE